MIPVRLPFAIQAERSADEVSSVSCPAMTRASWTLLVWMASDNDLEAQARRDLQEILAVGASSRVRVAVLVDRKRRGATRYLVPSRPNVPLARCPQERIGPLNTGDPRTLADFVTWGRRRYPSDRVALVLWNHGDGWRPYDPAHPSGGLRSKTAGPRYIAIDDRGPGPSDDDWLDMPELERALAAGDRSIDLLSFDACLMAQLEVLYQLRRVAPIVLASEEEMPLTGLPYRQVLAHLHRHPDITPSALAQVVAGAYLAWGPRRTRRTQSVVNAPKVARIAHATHALGRALADAVATEGPAIRRAIDHVQRYGTADYADLCDLAALVLAHVTAPHAREAAARVRDAIASAVLFHGFTGPRVERSTGLTVFLPRRRSVWLRYRPSYLELAFARRSRGWVRFLDHLPRRDGSTAAPPPPSRRVG